ncbi:hypothetical protein AVEN_96335-1 [Araneus ventricosus]|uniref:Uncharacterized protein n=1 Tax=Araneus ventricosus TaxID=182803 RepID=A0A4Y2WCD1_ARAVE|nr:hypothetical protein AVEN_96335-1 [Araneus ventricosus]
MIRSRNKRGDSLSPHDSNRNTRGDSHSPHDSNRNTRGGLLKLFGYNLMTCRMSSLQMVIRFCFLKSVPDRGPECVFGLSPRPAKPGSFFIRRLNSSYIVSPLSRSEFSVSCAGDIRFLSGLKRPRLGSRRSTFREQFEILCRGKRINI